MIVGDCDQRAREGKMGRAKRGPGHEGAAPDRLRICHRLCALPFRTEGKMGGWRREEPPLQWRARGSGSGAERSADTDTDPELQVFNCFSCPYLLFMVLRGSGAERTAGVQLRKEGRGRGCVRARVFECDKGRGFAVAAGSAVGVARPSESRRPSESTKSSESAAPASPSVPLASPPPHDYSMPEWAFDV